MKSNVLTEWSWAVALWFFQVFCLAWLAVVVLLGARAVVGFLDR